jgi:VCBS repeat-containing protein
VLNADGTVSYTPDANYFGTDSFTYRSNDGQTDSANVATVSITITPVNDAPIAVDDTATTPEDTLVVLDLLANDSDADSSTLSVVSLSAPLHGSAVLNADGTVSYTPDANYFGTDSFTYRTNDGQADSANVATVSITITPVNDAPIAVDDTATTPEDTAVVLNLVANDSDVDSSTLSVVSLSAPLHGSAVLNADGTVTYTPDANYFGTDSFTYRTNDGQADSANVATVSITITPVNDAPIAVDDTATTPEDTAVVLNLVANDSDVDSSTLSIVSLSAPLHGSAVLNADGTVTYTPDANYFGTDSFTYRSNDGRRFSQRRDGQHHDHAGQRRADRGRRHRNHTGRHRGRTEPGSQRQRRRQQHAVGRLPERAAARQRGAERRRHGELHAGCELLRHRQLHLPQQRRPGRLGQRRDGQHFDHAGQRRARRGRRHRDHTGRHRGRTEPGGQRHRRRQQHAVGRLSERTAARQRGAERRRHRDLHAGCELLRHRQLYLPHERRPGRLSQHRDGQLSRSRRSTTRLSPSTTPRPHRKTHAVVLNLLANDTDVDSSTLSVVSLSAPLHGSAVLNADGTVTYTPDANYFGTDSFTYRTNDGQADSANVATVSITITPVNDAPSRSTTPRPHVGRHTVVLDLLANDTDVDSSTLSSSP